MEEIEYNIEKYSIIYIDKKNKFIGLKLSKNNNVYMSIILTNNNIMHVNQFMYQNNIYKYSHLTKEIHIKLDDINTIVTALYITKSKYVDCDDNISVHKYNNYVCHIHDDDKEICCMYECNGN